MLCVSNRSGKQQKCSQEKIIIIKWENAIENVYMVFNCLRGEGEDGEERKTKHIE